MNKNFSYYVEQFFSVYLPKTRNLSHNTIYSYRDTIVSLINFFKKNENMLSNDISLSNLTLENVEKYIIWLKDKEKLKDSSINVRIAAIMTFIKFLQNKELNYFNEFNRILSIENKKVPKNNITYLSVDDIKKIMNTPNTKNKQEFRELVILMFIYETGCRVQELCDLKFESLNLKDTSTVTLLGKGNKSRIVPINKELKRLLENYIEMYRINNCSYLFKNKYGNKITRQGIQYIFDKYSKIIMNKENYTFPCNLTPHVFRHSKAMHLLESGVNLIYIRDFLGHESITTTEIYAKTNSEIKRKELEKNRQNYNLDTYSDEQKQQLEDWLKKL